MNPKRGLVIEGGGFRACYAAGAVYELLKSAPDLHFDLVAANSASVCTAAYFVTRQIREIEQILLGGILSSPKFLNFWRVPISWYQSLTDLDYLFYDVFTKQFPLDLKALKTSPTDFFVTVMHYATGRRTEFSNRDPEIFEAMKASCAVPWAYKEKIMLGGERYFDGFYDSVPLRIAKEKKCDETWIISTRPQGYRKGRLKLFEKIPQQTCRLLAKRHFYYNETAEEIEKSDKYIIVRPKEPLPVSRFSNNQKDMERVFEVGQRDMRGVIATPSLSRGKQSRDCFVPPRFARGPRNDNDEK